jgi:hypothetical protein
MLNGDFMRYQMVYVNFNLKKMAMVNVNFNLKFFAKSLMRYRCICSLYAYIFFSIAGGQ